LVVDRAAICSVGEREQQKQDYSEDQARRTTADSYDFLWSRMKVESAGSVRAQSVERF
jgi:hypothetical protein